MFKIKQLFLFIFLALISISCDDSHDHDHDEEHIDAEGFVLESDGVVVYRQFEGEVTIDNLILAVNDTLDLSVHFLDHDGDEIEHEDEEDEEEELSFSISDSNIISIEVEDHDNDGHDHGEEHHELAFELMGLSSGTTTFTLSLMHEGHADYVSLPISVTVNPTMLSCSGQQLCLNGCCFMEIYATK